MHGHVEVCDGCQHPELSRAEEGSGAQHRFTFSHIFAQGADVAACVASVIDADTLVAQPGGVLLANYGVDPPGSRRPCENSRRLSGCHLFAGERPGRNLLDYLEFVWWISRNVG